MEHKGQKKHKDNIFKRWWRLTEPNKKFLGGQIFFYCGYAVFLSLITIFAAKTINCMYAGDWTGAFINLGIELATIIIRNVSQHLQYMVYGKQCTWIRNVVTKKIYHKFLSCQNQELNKMTKEKITNIALNNLEEMSEFADVIASFIAYSLQVVFTLIVVFSASLIAGAIVSVLGVVNFLAYYLFNKKLGRIMMERYEKKDDMFCTYSKVIDGKSIIKEYQGSERYEHEIVDNVNKFSEAYERYYNTSSAKTHLYYAFWNVIVYAITAFLLYKVSNGGLDISIYLIIVPYLTTCTDKLNTLFDKTSNLEDMRVDVDRVNLILELSDEELIKYGDINKDPFAYKLAFVNVSEYKKEGQKYTLENINMDFETGKVNVVKGPKENGKRVIFDIIRRCNMPDKGKVVLDNLNLYDYNEKTFKTHINYCASHPVFVNGTIKENLTLVDKDMEHIQKLCAEVGILNDVLSLNKGFDTNIMEVQSNTVLFMLGLVRALLTNCKILMIYEIPQDVPDAFRLKIVDLITKYNIDKTIILFTHTDDYDSIADVIYSVRYGRVRKVKAVKVKAEK